jgi:hypothetical protein
VPLNRGRLLHKLEITAVRELSRDDLEAIREKRTVPVVQRLRDPHHHLARLIASGLRPNDAALQSGYSLARVYTLAADPSFQNLVAEYRKDVHEAYVSGEEERYKTATQVNLKALRHINEHFDKADEEGELIPIGRALQVFSDTADRTGLVKKSVQANINVDFAARLEKAIRKSGQVRTINGRANPAQNTDEVRLPPPSSQSVPSRSVQGPRTYIEGNLVRKI